MTPTATERILTAALADVGEQLMRHGGAGKIPNGEYSVIKTRYRLDMKCEAGRSLTWNGVWLVLQGLVDSVIFFVEYTFEVWDVKGGMVLLAKGSISKVAGGA